MKLSSLLTVSWWGRIAGVLLFAVLIFGAVLLWLDYRYEQQLSAITELGEPISFAELPAFYGEIPPADDTREIWNQARQKCEAILAKTTPEEKARFEELPAHEFYATNEVNLRLNDSWKSLPVVEEYLAPRGEILDLVRRATDEGEASRQARAALRSVMMPT